MFKNVIQIQNFYKGYQFRSSSSLRFSITVITDAHTDAQTHIVLTDLAQNFICNAAGQGRWRVRILKVDKIWLCGRYCERAYVVVQSELQQGERKA